MSNIITIEGLQELEKDKYIDNQLIGFMFQKKHYCSRASMQEFLTNCSPYKQSFCELYQIKYSMAFKYYSFVVAIRGEVGSNRVRTIYSFTDDSAAINFLKGGVKKFILEKNYTKHKSYEDYSKTISVYL